MTINSSGANSGGREHQNIHLLPNETSLFAADFTPSPLLRHIKTGLVVTRDRVIVRDPQYMFLIIKVGHAESSVPIRHISEVTVGRVLSPRHVRAALICGVSGLFVMMTGSAFGPLAIFGILMGLVLLGFAAFQAWLARGLALTIAHTGGGALRVDVDKLEFDDMLRAGAVVQELVNGNSVPAPVTAGTVATAQPPTPPAPQPPVQPQTPVGHQSSYSPPPQHQQSAPPSIWRG
jgi:hypothetical protein